MTVRGTFRLVALLATLLIFALVLLSPYYSARLSLVLHGHPFARVVPKENLDIFKFVSRDSFACRALVFSNEKPLGWICLATGSGFATFVPFSADPNLEDDEAFGPWFVWFDFPLMIAWWSRWWLLAAQAVVLLLWVRQVQKRQTRC